MADPLKDYLCGPNQDRWKLERNPVTRLDPVRAKSHQTEPRRNENMKQQIVTII